MNTTTLLKKYLFFNDIKNEFTQNIDFSKTPIHEVEKKSLQNSYAHQDKNIELHDYIFKFYAYNELLSTYREKYNGIINKEDLKIYSDYQAFNNDFSKRIFSFILYACIAEAKHSRYIEDRKYHDNFKEEDNESKNQKELQDSFALYNIKEFEDGKENKIFSEFSKSLPIDYPDSYEEILNDHFELTVKFYDYLYENYNSDNIPESFKKNHQKEQRYKTNIDKNVLIMFEAGFPKKNNKIDLPKLKKFNHFWNFIFDTSKLNVDGDSGSLQREIIKKHLIQKSNIKNLSTEEVFEFLSVIFVHGFNPSRPFGGEAWKNISQHALSFCRGEINAEIFIDQALSLEHNKGHIFSKSFIFDDNFSSNYFNFFIEDNQQSLFKDSTHYNIKNLILDLQSSSSVLSLAHFSKQWNSLVVDLDIHKLRKIHPELNLSKLNSLRENFNSLQSFSNNLKFLPEMTALAKKLDYSIPSFDFVNTLSVSLQKSDYYNMKQFEKSYQINQLFNHIMDGNYTLPLHAIKKKLTTEFAFNLYDLNNHNKKNLSKELIGGKAKGLTELINKGFNVPKAMVFDTQTCLSYLSNPNYFKKQFKLIQQQISNYLTDENNSPLLVSVRSGAPVSIPGMMDSILNVGIDDNSYSLLCKIYTKEVINECAMSFMTQFCSSKFGLHIQFPKSLNKALDKFTEILIKNNIPCNRKNTFPLCKEEQVRLSVEAVFDSWNSPRAIAWRNEKNIPHNMGTAATIQQMVFGNKNNNSMTCVIFSRDCISGKNEIIGEYLIKAQGEDLVSGKKTPLPIVELKKTNPKIYQEIKYIAKSLEEEKKAIQDLEITVEDDKVYVLQMRNAVVSPEAQISLAKELDLNLLDIIQPKHLIGEAKVNTTTSPDFSGLSASPGLISGIIVKNKQDVEQYKSLGKPLIFFSHQALPEHAPIMIATQAFITEFGGVTSHAAILARSMEKPCIVGIGKQDLNAGDIFTIDAIQGKIWKGELPILINQSNAIRLSKKIITDNNIQLSEEISVPNISLKIWTSELSKSKILNQPKNNKHRMFLNISQQFALLLTMEHKKNIKINK